MRDKYGMLIFLLCAFNIPMMVIYSEFLKKNHVPCDFLNAMVFIPVLFIAMYGVGCFLHKAIIEN